MQRQFWQYQTTLEYSWYHSKGCIFLSHKHTFYALLLHFHIPFKSLPLWNILKSLLAIRRDSKMIKSGTFFALLLAVFVAKHFKSKLCRFCLAAWQSNTGLPRNKILKAKFSIFHYYYYFFNFKLQIKKMSGNAAGAPKIILWEFPWTIDSFCSELPWSPTTFENVNISDMLKYVVIININWMHSTLLVLIRFILVQMLHMNQYHMQVIDMKYCL